MPRAKRKSDAFGLVPVERVARQILLIRGLRVMLDNDLAALYGVPNKGLLRAMKRNQARFPSDFVFQLTDEEFDALRYQIGTSNAGRGGRRYAPYAFTEHGAVMLAAVLNSPIAIQASIAVVRAFVQLRELMSSNDQFRRKLDEIERKLSDHDEKIAIAFDAIRQLMDEPEDADAPQRPKIGYDTEGKRQARAGRRQLR